MAKPFWSNVPPPFTSARLWSPPTGTSSAVLQGTWIGLWVHWTGNRSFPCLGEECPKARHIRPGRWVGYVPIALPTYSDKSKGIIESWTPWILAINTEQSYQIAHFHADMPNVGLTIEREKGQRAFQLAKVARIKPVKGLPVPADVNLVVTRLFGMVPSLDTGMSPSSNGEVPPFADVQ